jgi:transposase
MRPKGTAEELERRRRRAVDLVKDGVGPTEAALIVGADRRTVQRWARRYEAGGSEALNSKPHPGGECRLEVRQRQRLTRLLLQGAQANGFSTDLWTGPRVNRVIRREFRVRYHDDHIVRLLRSLGWTLQRPSKKAYERDEEAIVRWVANDWPRIKKVAAS